MSKIDYTEVAMTTGSGTQDITIAGFGTVNGAIIFASWASALDVDANDRVIAIGMTDFTTDRSIFANSEHGVTPSDCHRGLITDFMRITQAGTPTADRSITTVVAITDGIRITPGQTGTAFRLKVILIQDTDIDVQQVVPSGTIDTAVTVTTGFATRLIIAASMQQSVVSQVHDQISYGFCYLNDPTFTQRCIAQRHRDGQTAQVCSGRISDNRLIFNCNNSGGSGSAGFASHEVTAVDATTWDSTTRDIGDNGNYIAMSLGLAGDSVGVFSLDLPNSAGSDWTPTLTPSISFTPSIVHLVLSKFDAYNASNNEVADAGPYGICTFNGSIIHTVSVANEQGANPTDCESRMSQALYLQRDNSAEHYNMDNPVLQSGGFKFAAADITTANAETDKAIGLAFAPASAAMMAKMMQEGHLGG